MKKNVKRLAIIAAALLFAAPAAEEIVPAISGTSDVVFASTKSKKSKKAKKAKKAKRAKKSKKSKKAKKRKKAKKMSKFAQFKAAIRAKYGNKVKVTKKPGGVIKIDNRYANTGADWDYFDKMAQKYDQPTGFEFTTTDGFRVPASEPTVISEMNK